MRACPLSPGETIAGANARISLATPITFTPITASNSSGGTFHRGAVHCAQFLDVRLAAAAAAYGVSGGGKSCGEGTADPARHAGKHDDPGSNHGPIPVQPRWRGQ